jgi:phosphoglycolate phosphatase-like HAD superfamily hydrolase
MILTAARKHEIDLIASWIISDSNIDIETGRNAGCRAIWIVNSDEIGNGGADLVEHSLLDAVNQLLAPGS